MPRELRVKAKVNALAGSDSSDKDHKFGGRAVRPPHVANPSKAARRTRAVGVDPALHKTHFESWADLQYYLVVYERSTHQVSCAETIVCTHAGKYTSCGKREWKLY
ncbi:hypothetical protein PR003_g8684 [Phytophthora rubi]|uniref:Uncharacterized protein n=1 Tax=Phytophthora rubi TaxID=129364 RepID=A0A6A3N409_9STRA|nr:hypothetical protein PR002_g18416 [Phytophthora rubi]KAE9038402.1 hypothetical protein PR001_g7970 [Phytophthora rubi]KAE9344014.1 hypothetical protein PR003_g8684 [Phytophthora rubi]